MKYAAQRHLSDEQKHVILSLNPKAGRGPAGKRAERLKAALEKAGMTVELLTDLNEVAQKANALFHEGKLRALIGIGGDGTAAELTNRTDVGVPIALLPSGTANLLATHLRYSFNPEKFARMIVAGNVTSMDAATANGRLFLAMCGCGFDAEVVNQVHQQRMANPKGAHIGYHSYFKPILRAIFGYRFPRLRIEILDENGQVSETLEKRHWSFICNIPKYGCSIPIAPGAKFDDGQLDLCAWRGGSLYSGLILAGSAMLSLHRWWWRCTRRKGQAFRVSLPEETMQNVEVPYQLDGDPGGVLPVEIQIIPNRVTVFVR